MSFFELEFKNLGFGELGGRTNDAYVELTLKNWIFSIFPQKEKNSAREISVADPAIFETSTDVFSCA